MSDSKRPIPIAEICAAMMGDPGNIWIKGTAVTPDAQAWIRELSMYGNLTTFRDQIEFQLRVFPNYDTAAVLAYLLSYNEA